MAIVLFRVDERLIHGQVVVGWGTRLHPNRIVVVDDDLAVSPWEQDLYTLGLPDDLRQWPPACSTRRLRRWPCRP